MKNIFKIFPLCVVLMFAFSISIFARENIRAKQNPVKIGKTVLKKAKEFNCLNPNMCRDMKEQAANAAYEALVDCNFYGTSSQQCTDSINNAGLQRLYAEFWCSLYPENAKLNTNNYKRDVAQNKRLKLAKDSSS